jgi:hypothetical protein
MYTRLTGGRMKEEKVIFANEHFKVPQDHECNPEEYEKLGYAVAVCMTKRGLNKISKFDFAKEHIHDEEFCSVPSCIVTEDRKWDYAVICERGIEYKMNDSVSPSEKNNRLN